MSKTASQPKKDRSRPWQRAATRASILAAARRVIERVGTDSLSLTAVAREADFAPATVFAYFANKNDLFLSVLACDLDDLARLMRENARAQPREMSPPAADAPAIPAPRGGEDAPKLHLIETAPFVPDLDAAAGASSDWASQEDIARLLRDALAPDPGPPASIDATAPNANAASPGDVAHAIAQLQEAIARLEARPVDQWLERRLREFERGLAALEARPEKAEMAATLAAVDETLRKLATRVDAIESRQTQVTEDIARAMAERGERIEQRLRECLSDVEAAGARVDTRLIALENAAFAVAPEFFQTGTSAPERPVKAPAAALAEPIAERLPASPAPSAGVAPDADSVSPETGASYLSAARRAALAAAQDEQARPPGGSHPRRMSKRVLAMIAAGLGLVVATIWTGVFVRALAVPAPPRLPSPAVAVARAQKLALKPDAESTRLQDAEAGNAKAQLAVALDFLDGPRRNDALAARWLGAAARQGEAFAAFKLASLYRAGRGVRLDNGLAFRWFAVAARKGNCKAMQDLAVAYAEGWGTDRNPSEAARWFTRAADFGLTDAQFNLGVLYEEGLGVPQSLLDAYKWYLIAAGAGDREAADRVEAIKPQLSSSDVAAAEEAAASFKAASPDRDANVAPEPTRQG